MKKSLLTLGLALACVAVDFSLAMHAQAQNVTFLAEFNGTNGSDPNGVTQGPDGNFYGTLLGGGAFNQGEIFRMTPSGEISAVYSFNGTDGIDPEFLLLGSDGSFYGINSYGGDSGGGMFFRVTTGGKFTQLHGFCAQTNCTDGQIPNGLFLGFDGNFYGTTAYGGQSNQGVFFRVSASGEYKVLHSICLLTNCQDGNFPLSPIQGLDGNFYGVTASGGQGPGVIYKLTPDGTYEVIHEFCDNAGCPAGGLVRPLVRDPKGNIFGMTSAGGSYGCGEVYELTAEQQFKVLHSFRLNFDGEIRTRG